MIGVFSGEVLKGKCGALTGMIDYKGEVLHIGDIVFASYVEFNGFQHSVFLSAVCCDKYTTFNDGTITTNDLYDTYVMGIAKVTENDLAKENEDGELTAGWLIERIKSYKDVVAGEHWKEFGIRYAPFPLNAN